MAMPAVNLTKLFMMLFPHIPKRIEPNQYYRRSAT